MSRGASVPLNRSELNYLAMEGILGSVGMHFVLRFEAPLPRGALESAMRRLVSLHPRLRGVVVSRPGSHRLRILDDDARTDRLFHAAYREVDGEGADAGSVERYVEALVNTRFDIRRGFAFRAHVLLGGAAPVLVFAIHHVLADGRSGVAMIDDLMQLLNGQEPPAAKLEDPSMMAAILPRGAAERRDALVRSYGRHRRQREAMRGRRVIRLDAKGNRRFGPIGVRIRLLPIPMKAMRRAASARGCTVGSLVLAAIASAIGTSEARSEGDLATVRISVDLRRYFPEPSRPVIGNYVGTFLVPLAPHDPMESVAREAEAGMRDGIAAFERHEMSYPLLQQELASLLGPTFFSVGARVGKRLGLVPVNTCHYSNLGDIQALNRHGGTKVAEFYGTAPNVCPFITTMGLGDRVSLAASFDRGEISDLDADVFMDAVGRAIVELVGEHRASGASTSAPPPP